MGVPYAGRGAHQRRGRAGGEPARWRSPAPWSPTADRIVEHLVDSYLLEAVGADRFQLHDLLRVFAREQCIAQDSEADRAHAMLDDMGTSYRRLNRFDEAARCHSASLDLYRRVDDPQGEALSLLSHAETKLDQGQAETALGHCQQALEVSQRIGLKYAEARSLLVLGRIHSALGDIDQARGCWHESLAGFEAIRAAEAADVRALLDDLPRR